MEFKFILIQQYPWFRRRQNTNQKIGSLVWKRRGENWIDLVKQKLYSELDRRRLNHEEEDEEEERRKAAQEDHLTMNSHEVVRKSRRIW